MNFETAISCIQGCAGFSLYSGGPARSVSSLCRALLKEGCSVEIVRGPKDSSSTEVALPSKANIHFLKAGWSSLSDNNRLRMYLTQADSIFHSHGIWLPFNHQFCRIPQKTGKPYVISPRGMLEPWALNYKRWKKRLVWHLYQYRDLKEATAFHATAEAEAMSIRRLGFQQPIAVIPNGVELPELVEHKPIEAASQARTALFLSRIHPKKGLPMLLEAWAALKPGNWRLVIAGHDEAGHTVKLKSQVVASGLRDAVRFAGPLEGTAKDNAFRNADLFVLPSHSENFGIVVAEALSYGLPVLTTTGCPWRELKEKDCGWWVQPTREGILAGLQDALSQPRQVLVEKGHRGRKVVENRYQWPAIGRNMQKFYSWLLNNEAKPDFVV